MLPLLLSSELCSLRGDVLRYAFSVIWELDENAEIISTRFTKSLIKSRAALTYQQAQDMIDGKAVEIENKKKVVVNGEEAEITSKVDKATFGRLTEALRGLMKLSQIIRERRRKRGSLTLASMEIRFDFDEEGNTIGVMQKKALATMSMIEEFMLLANVSVADEILKHFPGAAMLRRHPTPTTDAFKPLVEVSIF
jgi:exosome complex exonuclease DIS3/RRP44